MAGTYVEVNKDAPVKKGDKVRVTMSVNAPYNEFNAQLLVNAFKLKSAILKDVHIDRFLYGEGAMTPHGPGPFRFIMECTALRDLN